MEGLTMSNYQTRQDALNLNIAGVAYNRMITWLQNSTMVSMSRTQGMWIAALTRPVSPGSTTLTRSWIAWNGDGRVSWLQLNVPASWPITATEDLLTGARTALNAARTVMVGEMPVLLRQ